MKAPHQIEGISTRLRLVETTDAEFLFGLRVDPDLSRHLSPVSGNADAQRTWIENYKVRESNGLEAYYIVETEDGRPCGTVRLYDIQADVFTWGSFVLTRDKPAKAALDVTIHSLGIGFTAFGCSWAEIDAKIENTQALSFYDRFGMTRYGEDDGSILMRQDRSEFEANRERLLEIVQNAHA